MSNDHVNAAFHLKAITQPPVATWRELVAWGIVDEDQRRDDAFAAEWSRTHQANILAERGKR